MKHTTKNRSNGFVGPLSPALSPSEGESQFEAAQRAFSLAPSEGERAGVRGPFCRLSCGFLKYVGIRISGAMVALIICGETAWGQFDTVPIPKGYVQVEGDVIMTESEAAKLLGEINQPSFTYAPGRLWPNRVVPYKFDDAVSEADRAKFEEAMDWWEASYPGVTTISFQETSSEDGGFLFLKVEDPGFKGGVTDNIGYSGGRVTIKVHPDSVGVGLIAHEVGHALGLWHEQSRSDRDDFVTIVWDNIKDGFSSQFEVGHADPQRTFGPYDYGSIMHYGQCAFKKCDHCDGCETIRALHPEQQTALGQRGHLSDLEQRLMAFRYAPANWKFLHQESFGSSVGSFATPYSSLAVANDLLPANSTLWLGPGTYEAGGIVMRTKVTLRAAIADLQMRSDGSLGPSSSGNAILR